MLNNPDTRTWLATIFGVAILTGIFGADLLFFHQAGTTADVGLIVGATAALGMRTTYVAGKQAVISNLTIGNNTPGSPVASKATTL